MTEWDNSRFDRSLPILMKRAEVAASLIEPNASVLDVGCGHRLIRGFLSESSRYFGFDKNPVEPDIPVFDLDKHEFPDGSWDYVVILGTLAWIKETEWTLRKSKESAHKLVTARPGGKKGFWITELLDKTGWRIATAKRIAADRLRGPEMLLCIPNPDFS